MEHEQIRIKKGSKASQPSYTKSDLVPLNTNTHQSPQIQHYRDIGNQAVQRMVDSGVIQPKLKVGQPNDKYEQEADRVADQVMRMPEPKQSLVNGHSSLVQRQSTCPECSESEEIQTKSITDQITPLQAKQANNQQPVVTPTIESRINSIKGRGQPLPESIRTYFEPRFGQDFSQVRVHTGTVATASARAINAKAFTVGQNIVFGHGQYPPQSDENRKILAHEIVHTVQQTKSNARSQQTTLEVSSPGDTLELETNRLADIMMRSEPYEGSATSAPTMISRLRDETQYSDSGAAVIRAAIGRGGEELQAVIAALELAQQQLGLDREQDPSSQEPGWLVPVYVPGGPVQVTREDIPTLLGEAHWEDDNSLQWHRLENEQLVNPRLIPRIEEFRDAAKVRLRTVDESRVRTTPSMRGGIGTFAAGNAPTTGTATHLQWTSNQPHPGVNNLLRQPQYQRFQPILPAMMDLVRHEGGSAAINTYDNQIVTIGAGFSMRSSRAQRMLEHLPWEMQRQIYDVGIYVGEDADSVRLLTLDGIPHILSGMAALEALRWDRQRLAFIQELLSSEGNNSDSDQEGTPLQNREWSPREWALRAQIQELCEANRAMPNSALAWPQGVQHLALQLHHGLPGPFHWSDYANLHGDATYIARVLIVRWLDHISNINKRRYWYERVRQQEGTRINFHANWDTVEQQCGLSE